jgi:hypothetical protein
MNNFRKDMVSNLEARGHMKSAVSFASNDIAGSTTQGSTFDHASLLKERTLQHISPKKTMMRAATSLALSKGSNAVQ